MRYRMTKQILNMKMVYFVTLVMCKNICIVSASWSWANYAENCHQVWNISQVLGGPDNRVRFFYTVTPVRHYNIVYTQTLSIYSSFRSLYTHQSKWRQKHTFLSLSRNACHFQYTRLMHIDVKLQMYSVKIAVLTVRTIPQNPPHSSSLLMCITVGNVSVKKKKQQ